MAAKRLHDGSEKDSDEPDGEKRLRALPSFSTVIREAVTAKQMHNLLEVLEPLLRRVVKEEVEGVLINRLNTARLIPRCPQMQIEAADISYLQLVFQRQPSLPIFTGSKIEDSESKPLQILLIDTRNGGNSLATLHVPLRVELVVLNGDFPSDGRDNWTSSEFEHGIVRERTSRRPLLTGDTNLTLRGGIASAANLVLTDNSSWIRSQHFRIGVRIAPGSYEGQPRIKEGVTQRFRARDHRGESYKKHYPPHLTDEVWRLEKISKDGIFHTRLSAENINTVQDFLKLSAVDASQLRRILGAGMTDRAWKSTIEHARTCLIGEKTYMYRKQNYAIFLSSICEIIRIELDCIPYSPQELNSSQMAYVQEMVREAYRQWSLLEVSDGMLCNTALLQNEPIVQEAIEASSSNWYSGQGDSPEFQFGEEFDQVGSITTATFQWSHANNIFG